MYEMQNFEDTVPKIDWFIKQNLTTGYHPFRWYDYFMPILKIRLTEVMHWTSPSDKKDLICQLHSWACSGKKY